MKPIKIALATLLLTSSAATLAEPNGPGKRMFDKIDADGDGFVSFEEFQPPRERKGPKADLDNNGEVTREEMTTHVAAKNAKMIERANSRFENMDSDGDGVVTKLEAREAAFFRMDTDQDGFLSPKEMKRGHKRNKQKKGKNAG